jgi:acyl CoA:acetate/3-ketoacid CoA transferase beta subunit
VSLAGEHDLELTAEKLRLDCLVLSHIGLGIALRALVPEFVPHDVERALQSENGILGVGVMDVTNHGPVLRELAAGVTEDDIRAATGPAWTVDLR